jgi:hypothetical protein
MGRCSSGVARRRAAPDGSIFAQRCSVATESSGGARLGRRASSGEPATAQGGNEAMRGAGELGHARPGGGALNKHGERSSPGAHAKEGPAAAPWPAARCGPRWAPRGPRPGRRREEEDWVGPSGSAQLDRIDIFFFEIFFLGKDKSRNV